MEAFCVPHFLHFPLFQGQVQIFADPGEEKGCRETREKQPKNNSALRTKPGSNSREVHNSVL